MNEWIMHNLYENKSLNMKRVERRGFMLEHLCEVSGGFEFLKQLQMQSGEHKFNWGIFELLHQVGELLECLIVDDLCVSAAEDEVRGLGGVCADAMPFGDGLDFLQVLWVVQVGDSA